MYTRRRIYGMRAYDWSLGALDKRTGKSFVTWPSVFTRSQPMALQTSLFRSLLKVGVPEGKDLYLLVEDAVSLLDWWYAINGEHGHESWFARGMERTPLGLYVIVRRQTDVLALRELLESSGPNVWPRAVIHAFPAEPLDLTKLLGVLDHAAFAVRVGSGSGPEHLTSEPMQLDWLLSIRDQAYGMGLPFTFLGWAGWVPSFNYPEAIGRTKTIKGTTYTNIGGRWYPPQLAGRFEENTPGWLEAVPIDCVGPAQRSMR